MFHILRWFWYRRPVSLWDIYKVYRWMNKGRKNYSGYSEKKARHE